MSVAYTGSFSLTSESSDLEMLLFSHAPAYEDRS